MADARLRKFDVILVWKLDRFARSLQQLIENIQLLDSYGVRFIAVTQSIDTDKQNPAVSAKLPRNSVSRWAACSAHLITAKKRIKNLFENASRRATNT